VRLAIPSRGTYDIEHVVLDMNGTLAVDGEPVEGLVDRLARLGTVVDLAVLTADTHGGASRLRESLGLETIVLQQGGEAEQKLEFVRRLGIEHVIAIGNGANDTLMLEESAIGVCVVGAEGASVAALLASDVVVSSIGDALDLLLTPQRLVATLRR
jgi:soluble P-type ATPase